MESASEWIESLGAVGLLAAVLWGIWQIALKQIEQKWVNDEARIKLVFTLVDMLGEKRKDKSE